MNRNAAAKFLEILLMTGQVEMLEHGMSKIFILSRRTGIPTMLDRSGDFIIVLDSGMRIVQVNDNYLTFAGIRREELLGKSAEATICPVIGGSFVLDKIQKARFGDDVRTEVKEVIRGSEFFFDIRLTPTVFNDGKRGVTIIIGDITEEKEKEMSLRESEENFRTLFGESPIGTAVFDSAGYLLNANPAFLSGAGVRTRQELGTLNIFSISGIPAGSHDRLDAGNNVTFESEGNGGFLAPSRHSSGATEKSVFEFRVTRVSIANRGRQNGYLVQFTERRVKILSDKEEDHSLLAEILSCIDEAVILLDYPSLSISFVNQTAENVFGYPRKEFLEKDPAAIISLVGSFANNSGAHFKGLKESGYMEIKSELMRRSGERFQAKQQVRPIYRDDGSIRSLVMVISDLTGRSSGDSDPVGNKVLFRELPNTCGFSPEFPPFRNGI
jgi:PAS domain S-box-containing protein